MFIYAVKLDYMLLSFELERDALSSTVCSLPFYPTGLKCCRGIVFTHGVRMGGRASGQSDGWAGSGKTFVPAVSQKL